MQSTDCIGKESDTSGSFLSVTEPTTPLYNADRGRTRCKKSVPGNPGTNFFIFGSFVIRQRHREYEHILQHNNREVWFGLVHIGGSSFPAHRES